MSKDLINLENLDAHFENLFNARYGDVQVMGTRHDPAQDLILESLKLRFDHTEVASTKHLPTLGDDYLDSSDPSIASPGMDLFL